MAEKVNLNRVVFDKTAFNNTIDTNFTQLVSTPDPTFFDVNLATVDDFFILYNRLFFDIPQFGITDSHEFLINKSSEYINYQKTNETIQALLDEIASLRQEILDIQLSSVQETGISTQLSSGVPASEIIQEVVNRSNQSSISNNR